MTPPEPRWRGARAPELSWQDGVPRSNQFQDSYFSHAGGADESRHVFLAGNRLPGRWAGEHFTIVETGFGTGLNFLTTWQSWRERGAGGPLHFLSIEAFPVIRDDLGRALSAWPQLAEPAQSLLEAYPPPLPGMHRLVFEGGQVCLDLLYTDLAEALATLRELPGLAVDAWYLDGFAPARNPDMWTADLFETMAILGKPGCTFATFTAAGDVRRGLGAAGFDVEKVPGYGNKREMLRGELSTPPSTLASDETPWHLPRHRYPEAPGGRRQTAAETGPVAVLGAGLAGAAVARALARRGYTVTVLDSQGIAGGASGNHQGALYTRLSHRASALNDFSLHSFSFATRQYRDLLQSGELTDGELCGALHLRPHWGPGDDLFETVTSLPELVQPLSAAEAEAVSGISGCGSGLYYPDSGWLNPPAVCRSLLGHPDIETREGLGELTLTRVDDGWQILSADGEVFRAAVVIVACGAASARVAGIDWLRLQPIRGQTSQVPSRGALVGLNTVICHEGYLPPARNGEHCLGATFDIDDPEPSLRSDDHRANLDQVARALPSLAQDLPSGELAELDGRVGYRCASPDYLPVVGPVPDAVAFCDDFAALRRNAKQHIATPGSYRPGLYINTAHGSRGLTSTPLAAELLAAQISGEAWPIPAALAKALAPARFLVRDLVRNRR